MQKYVITKNGVKTKEVTKEWIATEKQYQKELVRIDTLCYYTWGDQVGTFKEMPTREYQKHKDKWGKILVESK